MLRRGKKKPQKRKSYQRSQQRQPQPNELVFDTETDRYLPYSFIKSRERQRKDSAKQEEYNSRKSKSCGGVARFLMLRERVGRRSTKQGLQAVAQFLKSQATDKSLRTPDDHAGQTGGSVETNKMVDDGFGCAETLLGVLKRKSV